MLIYGDRYGAYTYINGIRIPLSPRQFPMPFMNTEGKREISKEDQEWIDKNVVKKPEPSRTSDQ